MFVLSESPTPEMQLKISGSRFISQLFSVNDASQSKIIVKELWSLHPSATHICWAYRCGKKGAPYQSSDDGEPSGSAGLPILNTLKSKQLSNVLATVIRYYGGTQLGVSGLIKAYKKATELAIESAVLVPYIESKNYVLQCNLKNLGELKNRLQKSAINHSISISGDVAVVNIHCSNDLFASILFPLLSSTNFQLIEHV